MMAGDDKMGTFCHQNVGEGRSFWAGISPNSRMRPSPHATGKFVLITSLSFTKDTHTHTPQSPPQSLRFEEKGPRVSRLGFWSPCCPAQAGSRPLSCGRSLCCEMGRNACSSGAGEVSGGLRCGHHHPADKCPHSSCGFLPAVGEGGAGN